MGTTDHSIRLYGAGLFQYSYPPPNPLPITYDQELAQLQNAGFNTIVLWALHVHSTGDFYYNDTLAVQNGQLMTSSNPADKMLNPDFVQYLQELKGAGVVNQILVSIGPFQSDYDAIADNWSVAQENFKALSAALPIDGYDFDYEGNYAQSDVTNLVNMTLFLGSLGTVTYCPYMYEDFWLQCLAGVYAQNNSQQIVSSWNLQCYDGGAGNDPSQWAQAIQSYGSPTGVTDPNAFIVPGYWVKQNIPGKSMYGQCPSQIQNTFAGLQSSGTTGGFLWNSSDIFNNETTNLCPGESTMPSDYATAMINGLNGTTASASSTLITPKQEAK